MKKLKYKVLGISRNPEESHRQASFLELFYDLCFVAAIAYGATELHHSLAEGHIVDGLISFVAVFFGVWWTWLNYTWYASAYDTDDIPFRIATLIQIIGALIIASGVNLAFKEFDFSIITIGYFVIRISQIYLWIKSAYHDPERKGTSYRYAIGLALAMVGWVTMYFFNDWPLWAWLPMCLFELMVPFWAENKTPTPWHPHHMAERYSLFTIIVLGESVVAATQGLQLAISDTDVNLVEFIPTIFGGLLLLFSMWWIYFFKPSHPILEENKVPVLWGYGHFFIFASGTAVGAALVVAFEHVVHPDHLSDLQVGMFIGMSVIIYLFMVWLLIWRHQIKSILLFGLTLVCALLILASLLTSYSVLCMGISTSLLVVFLELKERKGYWNNGTRRNTLE